MSYGILFLRLVLGLTLAGHGAQKLFGALGGNGLRTTGGFFNALGFRAPLLMALAAGLAELGGGLLLAAGLLLPLAALSIAVVMLTAILTVHRPNGFWNTDGGYEYNLRSWRLQSRSSPWVEHASRSTRPSAGSTTSAGCGWALGVLGLGAAVSILTVTFGRRPEESAGLTL